MTKSPWWHAAARADLHPWILQVVSLGLSHLVVEMAVLLPDPAKKAQLLAAHEAASSSATASRCDLAS